MTIRKTTEADIPQVLAVYEAARRYMRSTLTSHGFTYCGIIHLASGAERLAFQKG